ELELELKSGEAAAMYDIALKLADPLHLRLEGQSKADRGYALVGGDAPRAVRAKPVAITARASLGAVLRAAGQTHIGAFIANMPAAGSAEAVHQMRVALRRLRGILKTADKTLPARQYAWINARFKHVLEDLGPARNWDVLCTGLEQAPDLPHRRTAGHRSLVDLAQRRRRAAHAQAAAHMTSPAVTRTMLEIGRWFERLAQPAPVKAASRALLTHAFKRLRKKSRDFEGLDADGRHKLRIAGKNMRYAAEVFAPLYDAKAVKRFLRGLKAQQDLLGALNDIRGAHELLAAARGARVTAAAGEVLGWFDHKAVTLEKRAAKAAKKLRESPVFW
ncbi:MAG: CYTH and CHAD domain-containing protein, partial [Rhodospirillaceae bacterium]